MVDYSKMSTEELLALYKKQNAPEPEPTWSEVGTDVAKTIPAGLARGTAAGVGMIGDIRDAAAKGAEWGANKLGIDPERAGEAVRGVLGPLGRMAPTGKEVKDRIEGVTGELYEPQTRTGKYVNSAVEMLPAALQGPGGAARKIAMQAVVPGLASEAAGQATEGKPYEGVARAAAALASPSVAQRFITPNRTSLGRAKQLDTLEAEGIDAATAGQRTGLRALQYAESTLGDALGAGQKATKAQQKANQQLTNAALKRAGIEPHAEINRESIAENLKEIRDTYNMLANTHGVRFDRPFANDLRGVLNKYQSNLDSLQKPMIVNILTDLARQGGRMSGEAYQNTRSIISGMATGVARNHPYAEALRGIRKALDEAAERTIPNNSPDKGLWKNTNKRYEAWKTLERGLNNVDDAGNVTLTPAKLRQLASSGKRSSKFVTGESPFSAVSDAASSVLKSLPNSGTVQRGAPMALALGSGAAGAGAGYQEGGLLGSGVGGIAGALAGPAIFGRTLMSRPVQKYLGNRAILGERDNPRAAMLRAILASQQAEEP